jgi:hypothetical protein
MLFFHSFIIMSPLPFIAPTTILIAGPTFSGKSFLAANIIRQQSDIFSIKPTQILYCYSQYQPLFTQLEDEISNLKFIKGLPNSQDIETLTKDSPHSLCILDDLMSEVISSQFCLHLATRVSHHAKMSLIYITQNLFANSRFSRSLNLNMAYSIICKNPKEYVQVKEFARRLGGNSNHAMMEAYDDILKQPFGYLLVDLNSKSNDHYRFRTNIFTEPIIYLYK